MLSLHAQFTWSGSTYFPPGPFLLGSAQMHLATPRLPPPPGSRRPSSPCRFDGDVTNVRTPGLVATLSHKLLPRPILDRCAPSRRPPTRTSSHFHVSRFFSFFPCVHS